MAMVRFLVCLAAACSCAALLLGLPPAQARVVGSGLIGRLGGHERPAAAGFLRVGSESKEQQQQQRVVEDDGNDGSSRWPRAPPAAGKEELRSVPAGPDPLHHHGSPKRPEQELRPLP
ncbi:hypothetical protein QYE76_066369 [Lolium multiflorum]|uniref:Uncharacterized protein n=1 Tax=Lolium multiflorum TaxID=4521 RepID=A0AAD8SB74_LOLMU|nr:hypothetical protein QYE76_066369 [Lolium multiflorum]